MLAANRFLVRSRAWINTVAVAGSFVVTGLAGAQVLPSGSGPTLGELGDQLGILIGNSACCASFKFDQNNTLNILREGNTVTNGLFMKPDEVQPQQGVFDFSDAADFVAFADAENLGLRGHLLLGRDIYHAPWFSGYLSEGNNTYVNWTPAQLESLMHTQVETVMEHYGDQVKVWDVFNEPFQASGAYLSPQFNEWANMGDEIDAFDGIGTHPVYMRRAFEVADQVRTDNNYDDMKLIFNVGSSFAGMAGTPQSDSAYELARHLVAAGVPIDGIGLQMHQNVSFANNEYSTDYEGVAFRNNLERLAALGLSIYITELDVALPDGDTSPAAFQYQADIYQDIFQAAVDQSAVASLLMWNPSDAHSWKPGRNPTLYDLTGQPKPAYFAARQVLLNAVPEPGAASLLMGLGGALLGRREASRH